MTRLCGLVKVSLYILGLPEKGEGRIERYMFTASSLLSIKSPFSLMFLLHAASLFIPANILPYSGATVVVRQAVLHKNRVVLAVLRF
jgi:hypothetical protein